jgi:hypothetical protein
VCVCVCVCVNRHLKCLHKATCQGPVYLCGRMIHGVHYTTLCLNHPESYVITRVGNHAEHKVLYVNICHRANMVSALKFGIIHSVHFASCSFYKTNLRHKLQTHSKYGVLPLLHFSTRLCHPHDPRGIHTPNLTLADI